MIKQTDHIVTAWAESCSGPGWANQPVWVIVKDEIGHLREECIQPNDQTYTMSLLFKISAMVSEMMRREVEIYAKKERR